MKKSDLLAILLSIFDYLDVIKRELAVLTTICHVAVVVTATRVNARLAHWTEHDNGALSVGQADRRN